jgi:Cupin domain
VLDGELMVKCDGQTAILREGESAVIEAGVWHDWWNASDRNARVRVKITPGERFSHMAETLFGLARLGHTDGSGMPDVLQLALIAREFRDVVGFRSPPPAVQNALFGALASGAPIRLPRDLSATFAHRARAARIDGSLDSRKVRLAAGLQVDRRIRRIQD